MTSLATIADVEDRLGRALTDEDERVRVEALLRDASSAVRTYTGQGWAGVGTVTRTVRVRNNYIIIRGVTSITTVTNAVTNLDVPYHYDGLDRLYLWPPAYQASIEYDFTVMPATVTVVYEADDPAPDGVVGVVCQMAMRAFGVDPTTSGHQQESIGGYSYSMGTSASSGGVGLLPDERRILDLYRRVGATIWVGGT